MKKFCLLLTFSLTYFLSQAQVSITGCCYSQGFGTTDFMVFTNNITIPGWYSTDGWLAHLNITATAPTNTGALYTYECNNDNNNKLGSRASGGTGTIQYGVVIQNNTGFSGQRLLISYRGYQLSLAENNANTNSIVVDYAFNATNPSGIITGAFSNAGINFIELVTDPAGGGTSNQINGFPCTQSSLLNSACINIPSGSLDNGEFLTIRFTDVDNTNNDHHMAIDDLVVQLFTTNDAIAPCVLPVDYTSFEGNLDDKANVNLNWITAAEKNNLGFQIERSMDGTDFAQIGFVQGAGNSSSSLEYVYTDTELPSNNISKLYYRLKQIDFDGAISYSSTIEINFNIENNFSIQVVPNPSSVTANLELNGLLEIDNAILRVLNPVGQLVAQFQGSVEQLQQAFLTQSVELAIGVYTLQISANQQTEIIRWVKLAANN